MRTVGMVNTEAKEKQKVDETTKQKEKKTATRSKPTTPE